MVSSGSWFGCLEIIVKLVRHMMWLVTDFLKYKQIMPNVMCMEVQGKIIYLSYAPMRWELAAMSSGILQTTPDHAI